MRDATAQYTIIMISRRALQQACRSHVSHAQNQDGQRCALLTTKSRNTCTRATVFNSSG
jgi:hypothetical protein